MATITSTTSGDWATGGTWVGGVAPVDGDTAVIATGHTVTVAASATIGTAPASNAYVVTIQGSGNLIIATGSTLTVRGGITITGSTGQLNMQAGSTISITAGTSRVYRINVGGDSSSAQFNAAGTADSRCVVTKTGAGSAYIQSIGYTTAGKLNWSYTDFPALGTSGTSAILTRDNLTMQHCTVIGSGQVESYDVGEACDFDVQYCHFASGLASNLLAITAQTTYVSGTRRFNYNSVLGDVNMYRLEQITFSGNYFSGTFADGSDSNYMAEWSYNWVPVDQYAPRCDLLENGFMFRETGDNCHFLLLVNSTPSGNTTVDGYVFEHGDDWTDDPGDCVMAPQSVAAETEVKNCITLPNAGGRCSGTFVTDWGLTGQVWRIHHNTFFAGGGGRARFGEGATGAAGQVEYFRDNIGWAESGDTIAYLLSNYTSTLADDFFTACDHNGTLNLNTVYNSAASTFLTTPGTHDLNADPAFVDKTRDLAGYSRTVLGHTGTDAEVRAAAIAAFEDLNYAAGANYHAGLSVQGLVDWIKAGFVPTNVAIDTASSTGGYIGAMDYVAPATDSCVMLMRCF